MADDPQEGAPLMARKRTVWICLCRGIPVSPQSLGMLRKLAEFGIYGRTPEEVAARFIDEGLQKFLVAPVLKELA